MLWDYIVVALTGNCLNFQQYIHVCVRMCVCACTNGGVRMCTHTRAACSHTHARTHMSA